MGSDFPVEFSTDALAAVCRRHAVSRLSAFGSVLRGEAASRVPAAVQERHPGLPWREAIGARNRPIHGYDFVDLDILWEIVATDLPLPIPRIERVLETESAS
jgi:uncharacterized protein with HEPN domain